eukprot:TRINITY_DN1392_c0_g2_i1.p1 TRINITY_DN1392_c0_g2~~TRINITY_DN1392_c0_g2_i1.p1  ORF type:complete len:167 (+),score=20.72 TRINITY_DN1392_c0_g2_i1:50-550(+)
MLLFDVTEHCPIYATFFGYFGSFLALVFANLGAAYGTAKSAAGVASVGVVRYDLVMKSMIAPVMAGILGIYGLIVAVIIASGMDSQHYPLWTGFAHLGAGLACGFSGMSAGFCIGLVGDNGVRSCGQQDKLFVSMILVLIFAEALGLYGLIVALIMISKPVPRDLC